MDSKRPKNAIVFTHGWMMNREIWARQEPLGETLRIITWDLPQHGRAHHTPPVIGLADCAQALRELITYLRLTEATYVGWSMGMSVFWRYCELFGSEPFVRVVNVEMLPVMDPKAAQVKGVEIAMRRDRHRAMERFASKIFYRMDESALQKIVAAADQVPLETALQLYREMAKADFSSLASQLAIPQQLVFGRHGFCAEHEQLIRQFFPHHPIVWFENSGHAPFWEEPKKFNQLIRELIPH